MAPNLFTCTFHHGLGEWIASQRIECKHSGARIRITKNQDHSTPGILRRVHVQPQRIYNLYLEGAFGPTTQLVVDGNRTIIARNRLDIRDGKAATVALRFNSGPHDRLLVGVLFRASAPRGTWFELERAVLAQADASECARLPADDDVEVRRAQLSRFSQHPGTGHKPTATGSLMPPCVVFDKAGSEHVLELDRLVPEHAILRATITYQLQGAGTLHFEGVSPRDGAVRFRRQLSVGNKHRISENQYAVSVVFMSNEAEKLTLRLRCLKISLSQQVSLAVTSFTIEKLHDRPRAPALFFARNRINICLASYPLRYNTILASIDSLVDQADNVLIYLNSFRQVPPFIADHCASNKIHYILDTASTRRAAAKFYWIDREGFNFTCDDDIIYPPDYVARMVAAIERYKRRAIVGVHGVNFQEYVTDSKASRKDVLRFADALASDQFVHLLGTDTLAAHSDTTASFDFDLIRCHGIANDDAMAVLARMHNIPMVCIARKEAWLTSNSMMNFGLYEEKAIVPEARTEANKLLRRFNPWTEPVYHKYIARLLQENGNTESAPHAAPAA